MISPIGTQRFLMELNMKKREREINPSLYFSSPKYDLTSFHTLSPVPKYTVTFGFTPSFNFFNSFSTYFSLVFNTIEIDYQKGKYDSNYCNKIIDYLKTNYMFSKYPETANAASNYSFSVQLDNGNNIMICYPRLSNIIRALK